MEITKVTEKYNYLQKFLLNNAADNQYLNCLEEIYLLAIKQSYIIKE